MPKTTTAKNAKPTSFRLSPEAIAILEEQKVKLGFTSRDDVVELSLRVLAGWTKAGYGPDMVKQIFVKAEG